MFYRILSVLMHIAAVLLTALFAPLWVLWILVAIEYLNGRHWFAETPSLFDYITEGYFNPLSVFVWACGEWPNWVGLLLIAGILLFLQWQLSIPVFLMALVHAIGRRQFLHAIDKPQFK